MLQTFLHIFKDYVKRNLSEINAKKQHIEYYNIILCNHVKEMETLGLLVSILKINKGSELKVNISIEFGREYYDNFELDIVSTNTEKSNNMQNISIIQKIIDNQVVFHQLLFLIEVNDNVKHITNKKLINKYILSKLIPLPSMRKIFKEYKEIVDKVDGSNFLSFIFTPDYLSDIRYINQEYESNLEICDECGEYT